MTVNTQSISTETLLEVLADPQRRTVLDHLRENSIDSAVIDELAETVVTDGGETANRHRSERKDTVVDLHHTHLPRLAEAGLVEYDQRGGTVRYHPNERAEKLLQFVVTELESPGSP